jgi:hypothetical protein
LYITHTIHCELRIENVLILVVKVRNRGKYKRIQPDTDDATNDENTVTRMAKSNRSRDVIYASGGQLSPTVARRSETMDGDGMREPE